MRNLLLPDETTQISCPGLNPLIGSMLDGGQELTDGGGSASETTCIPLLPNFPRGQGEESVGFFLLGYYLVVSTN